MHELARLGTLVCVVAHGGEEEERVVVERRAGCSGIRAIACQVRDRHRRLIVGVGDYALRVLFAVMLLLLRPAGLGRLALDHADVLVVDVLVVGVGVRDEMLLIGVVVVVAGLIVAMFTAAHNGRSVGIGRREALARLQIALVNVRSERVELRGGAVETVACQDGAHF